MNNGLSLEDNITRIALVKAEAAAAVIAGDKRKAVILAADPGVAFGVEM